MKTILGGLVTTLIATLGFLVIWMLTNQLPQLYFWIESQIGVVTTQLISAFFGLWLISSFCLAAVGQEREPVLHLGPYDW